VRTPKLCSSQYATGGFPCYEVPCYEGSGNQQCDYQTLWECWEVLCWWLLVIQYSICHLIMQATTLQEMLACECYRILVDKSENPAAIGQTTMNQFYPHLPSIRTVRNTVLAWIGLVQMFIQTSLTSLWSSCQTGPSWKTSHSLWCYINLHLSLLVQATSQAITLVHRCSVTPL
jgi:hypothetical protein